MRIEKELGLKKKALPEKLTVAGGHHYGPAINLDKDINKEKIVYHNPIHNAHNDVFMNGRMLPCNAKRTLVLDVKKREYNTTINGYGRNSKNNFHNHLSAKFAPVMHKRNNMMTELPSNFKPI